MVPLFGHPRKPRVGALDRTHGRAWLSVFLNSRGEVVAYDPHGNVAWSEETESGWINLKKFKASDRITPTLALFPLRTRTAHRVRTVYIWNLLYLSVKREAVLRLSALQRPYHFYCMKANSGTSRRSTPLFPLPTPSSPQLILASGSHTATLLTVSGEIVAEVEMPAPPARPLQVREKPQLSTHPEN